MSNPLVSVIIPAYNCEKIISRVISAVKNQNNSPLEIIVVNDGSTDATLHELKAIEGITVLNQLNSGPAKARNTGAQAAQGEFYFFTDSDCEAHPDWILTAIQHFDNPEVGVVAGSYDIANPDVLLAKCIHQEILFRHHRLMGRYVKAFGSYNFGIRAEIFDRIGGFNPIYPTASGEDNDLSYQVLNSGAKIYFECKALVSHYHQTQVLKYLKEQYRHGFWRVRMYLDHPQMVKGDDYTFWKDIGETGCVLLLEMACVLAFAREIYCQLSELCTNNTVSGVGMLILFFGVSYLMYSINYIYAKKFKLNNFGAIYYSFVLYFRSFFRTLGLSTGILANFFKIPIKKK